MGFNNNSNNMCLCDFGKNGDILSSDSFTDEDIRKLSKVPELEVCNLKLMVKVLTGKEIRLVEEISKEDLFHFVSNKIKNLK